LVASLNHHFAFYESIQLSDLNGERFIVRTHCKAFDSTTKLLLNVEYAHRKSIGLTKTIVLSHW
jgi:hypothetical protein